jgi:hypothetical protein
MKMRLNILSIFLVFSLGTGAQAIIVDIEGNGDFLTIQQGIDAANNDDTVLVYPGRYFENINYNGKNILIASKYLIEQNDWYIHNTVIDGNQQGSVVQLVSGENNAALNGFTITNGSGYEYYPLGTLGGGIYCYFGVYFEIQNCIIKENNVISGGGGILLWGSIASLSNVSIHHNHSYSVGGGITLGDTAQIIFDTINRCSIYSNSAPRGTDFSKLHHAPGFTFIVDTFTVINPDHYYVRSTDANGNHLNDIEFDILNGKFEAVNDDLFVSDTGDDNNSGTTPQEPLKSITHAMSKIVSDSTHPNTIHIANGYYSQSSTNERLPLGFRSYVAFEGQSMDSTVLDGENLTYHFHGNNYEKSFTLSNLTLKNGFGNLSQNLSPGMGSIYLYENSVFQFNKIIIEGCEGYANSGLAIGSPENLLVNNISFINNMGGVNLAIWGTLKEPEVLYLNNLSFIGFTGSSVASNGFGNGLSVGGSLNYPGNLKCIFPNLNIIDGHNTNPSGGAGAFCAGVRDGAWIQLINATIGNNTCIGNEGSLGIGYPARMDLYNTIVYNPDLPLEFVVYNPAPYEPCTLNVYNSLFRGEDEFFDIVGDCIVNWGGEILDTDPLWENSGAFPYQLSEGSPCINLGTPMYVTGMEPPYVVEDEGIYYLITTEFDSIPLPATDMAGNPRIVGGRIDMGAYEFQEGIFIQTPPPKIDLHLSAFPNPFSNETTISFSNKKSYTVIVQIYTINGRKVKTLMDAFISPGRSDMRWKGTDDYGEALPNGTYICRLVANNEVVSEVKIVKVGR